MALKAGYYGIKRRTKNLLLNLINSLPPGISPENPVASKSDVLTAVDLLDDTVGWLGKNQLSNYNDAVTVSRGITFTKNANLSVTANGTQDGTGDGGDYFFPIAPNSQSTDFPISNFPKLNGSIFTMGIVKTTDITMGIWYFDSSNVYISGQPMDLGKKELVINIPQNAAYFRVYFRVEKNKTVTNLTFYPMICEKALYDLSSAYEPYHASVAEMLTPIVYNTYKAINSGIVSESVTVRAVRNVGGIQIHVDFTVGENDISSWNNLIQFEPALKNGISMRDTVEAIRDVTDETLSAIKLVTITQDDWLASNNTFKAGHRYQFVFTYLT